MSFARTLGELRQSPFTEQRLRSRRVKDELRENLMSRLREGASIFPGIVGYDDTVVPQIVNAILSRHNFILLGLRGQAKSRILRALTALLDPEMPYVAGCEIHDNPYRPICRRCRDLVADMGDDAPVGWLTRDHRYVEKLATPDVTIADMIGDIDPIKAALDAGATRIRPVLMTAMAMIIGMIPMALGWGEGAEQNAPLGRAVIGGLLFATVSTLLFVPVIFAGIHRRLEYRKQSRSSGTAPVAEGHPGNG